MGLRTGLCLGVVVAVAPPSIGGSTLGPDDPPDALEVVPATAGCGSPFHREVGSAVVLFPPEPVVLPAEGLCHQFYGQPACCLPSYTLAVAAQVKAMEHRTANWADQSRVCVDRILELYTGVACSLCDPDWPRYSARQDHEWVVTVQEENCHYMWGACGRVLQSNMSAFEFCTSVANIVKTGELEKFFDLPPPTSDDAFTTTTTTTTTSTSPPPPKPVVAVVRHSKQRRFRLRGSRLHLRPSLAAKASAVSRDRESPQFVTAPDTANSTVNSTEKSGATSNETSSSNSSAGEEEEESGEDTGEDEDDGEDGEEEDDDAEAANVTIAANATEPPEEVETVQERPAACTGPAGNPCSLPFPRIAFSAEAHALSAVDEGEFGGYVRSSAAVFALVALVGGAS